MAKSEPANPTPAKNPEPANPTPAKNPEPANPTPDDNPRPAARGRQLIPVRLNKRYWDGATLHDAGKVIEVDPEKVRKPSPNWDRLTPEELQAHRAAQKVESKGPEVAFGPSLSDLQRAQAKRPEGA